MRVIFDCHPVYTTFQFLDASYKDMSGALEAIRRVTCARPENYMYMPSYKKGSWDGYIHLCKRSKIPTGLLPVVTDSLRDAGYPLITVNNYATPDINHDALAPDMFSSSGIVLRPYQVQAAVMLMSYGRCVAKMATNSGKTEVIAAIAKMVIGDVLVLLTGKDLMYQTADRLSKRLNENVGMVGDGKRDVQRVTVGMIQTLVNWSKSELARFADLHCVMFDECHHLPSKTSQDVLMGIPAPYRFGFSGTPLRREALADLVLMGSTGPIRVEVTNADLVAQGISARPIVSMHVVEYGQDMYDADWHEAYDILIVQNAVRNAIICKEIMAVHAASTLVLVERIAHGEALCGMIPNSAFVHGSSLTLDRQDALDSLRSGGGAIVIATPIFDEGVDVPSVELLVLAGGGKKHTRLLQRLGRGMRRKHGRNVLAVVDFIDDANEHLLRHSLARATVYEDEGFEVRIIE